MKRILEKFRYNNCKTTSLPIDPKLKLEVSNDKENVQCKQFRELVGCLMYLMLESRPDLSYAINFFSRFQDKATNKTFSHLKRVLRYLKETENLKLIYKRQKMPEIVTYVDSDWGGDTNDRKSVSGFLLKVFGNTVA